MPTNYHVSDQIGFARAIGHEAAGTSQVVSANFDANAAQTVSAIVLFGALTSTHVTSVELQDSQDGTSDWRTIVSSGNLPDGAANKGVLVEAARYSKNFRRHVRVVVNRGTANAVIDGAVMLFGCERVLPGANTDIAVAVRA